MPGREATPDRRGYKVSRASVVILDRKGIRGVKGLREISGHRGREVFRGRQAQPVRPDQWDRKV